MLGLLIHTYPLLLPKVASVRSPLVPVSRCVLAGVCVDLPCTPCCGWSCAFASQLLGRASRISCAGPSWQKVSDCVNLSFCKSFLKQLMNKSVSVAVVTRVATKAVATGGAAARQMQRGPVPLAVQRQQVETPQQVSSSHEKTTGPSISPCLFADTNSQSHKQSFSNFNKMYVSSTQVSAFPRLQSEMQHMSHMSHAQHSEGKQDNSR